MWWCLSSKFPLRLWSHQSNHLYCFMSWFRSISRWSFLHVLAGKSVCEVLAVCTGVNRITCVSCTASITAGHWSTEIQVSRLKLNVPILVTWWRLKKKKKWHGQCSECNALSLTRDRILCIDQHLGAKDCQRKDNYTSLFYRNKLVLFVCSMVLFYFILVQGIWTFG